MKCRQMAAVLMALCALAAGRAAAQSGGGSATYQLDWATVGVASGGDSASANYRLVASIGLAEADTQSDSAGYRLCSGAQCASPLLAVFVPVVIR